MRVVEIFFCDKKEISVAFLIIFLTFSFQKQTCPDRARIFTKSGSLENVIHKVKLFANTYFQQLLFPLSLRIDVY